MIKNGFVKLTTVAAAGILALTACSSNTPTASSPSPSVSAAVGPMLACPVGSILGAGSTAQSNATEQTTKDYAARCINKAKIIYAGGGSGEGIKKFVSKQVNFTGSDSTLSPEETVHATEACGNNALHIPVVAAPIAVVFTIDGVDKLSLKADTLAAIMKGDITKWDDAKIKADNPHTKLPSADITVFFRSDSSGTTDNFTTYLNQTAGTIWTDTHDKVWKGTGQGKEKSIGIQQALQQNKNSISYIEWSFAKDGNLKTAAIDSGAGPIELTAETAGKALETATVTGSGNDLRMELRYANAPAGAYPIVLITYEIVCSAGTPMGTTNAALVKDFLTFYASHGNQKNLVKLGYVPLPSKIQQQVSTAINSMK